MKFRKRKQIGHKKFKVASKDHGVRKSIEARKIEKKLDKELQRLMQRDI